MISLAIAILWLLIGLVILVGIGWIALWVLNQLGIIVPPMVVKLALIVLGLLVLIYALSLVGGGGGHLAYPRLSSIHTVELIT